MREFTSLIITLRISLNVTQRHGNNARRASTPGSLRQRPHAYSFTRLWETRSHLLATAGTVVLFLAAQDHGASLARTARTVVLFLAAQDSTI